MRCFAAYVGKREEMNLRVARAGARVGDVFRLEERKAYRMNDFLRDFDEHKAEALKNAELLMGKEGLQMEVDGRSFALREAQLDARGLRAVLSAKIESTNRSIRFTFDGERVTAKLADDSRIIGLKSEHGLAVKYDKGGGAIRTFQLVEKFEREVLNNRIRLTSIPKKEQGVYRLEVDQWLSQHIRDRLARSSGSVFLREKGDISEEICRYALSLTPFWKEIADHPHGPTAEGSRRTGPDSLQRLLSSGELFYFEFKWWSIRKDEAFDIAWTQVEGYLKRFPTDGTEKIAGAYIGILDWDIKSNALELHLERVI